MIRTEKEKYTRIYKWGHAEERVARGLAPYTAGPVPANEFLNIYLLFVLISRRHLVIETGNLSAAVF